MQDFRIIIIDRTMAVIVVFCKSHGSLTIDYRFLCFILFNGDLSNCPMLASYNPLLSFFCLFSLVLTNNMPKSSVFTFTVSECFFSLLYLNVLDNFIYTIHKIPFITLIDLRSVSFFLS